MSRVIPKLLLAELTMFSTYSCYCPVPLKVTQSDVWLSTKLIGILSKQAVENNLFLNSYFNSLIFQWI